MASGKIGQILYIREGIQEAVPVGTDRTKKRKNVPKQTNLPKAFALSSFPVKFLLTVPNSDEDIEISRISTIINLFGRTSLEIPAELQMLTPRWSRIIFENNFKSEKISKEVERTFFRPQGPDVKLR